MHLANAVVRHRREKKKDGSAKERQGERERGEEVKRRGEREGRERGDLRAHADLLGDDDFVGCGREEQKKKGKGVSEGN